MVDLQKSGGRSREGRPAQAGAAALAGVDDVEDSDLLLLSLDLVLDEESLDEDEELSLDEVSDDDEPGRESVR